MQHEDGHPKENLSTVSNATDQKSHEPSIAEDVTIAAADIVDQAKEAEELAAAKETVDSNQQAHPDETKDHCEVEPSNSERAVDPELSTPQTDSLDIPLSEPAASLVEPDQVGEEQVDSIPTLETTEPAVPPVAVDETVMNEDQSSPQEIPLTDSAANLEGPEKVGEKELELAPTMQTSESDLPPVEVSEPIQASETQISPQDTLLPDFTESLVEPEKVEQELESTPTPQAAPPEPVIDSKIPTISPIVPTSATPPTHLPAAQTSHQEIPLADSAENLVQPENVRNNEAESNPIVEATEFSAAHVAVSEAMYAPEAELSPQDASLPEPGTSLTHEKAGQDEVESPPAMQVVESDVLPVDVTDAIHASDAHSSSEMSLSDSNGLIEIEEARQVHSSQEGEVESIPMPETTESGIPSVENTDAMQESDARAVHDPLSALHSSAAQSESQTQAQLPLNDAVTKATSPSPERLCEHSAVEEAGLVETESLSDHVSDHEQRGSINPATLSHSKTGELLSDRVSDHLETAAEQPSSPDTLQMPSQSGDVGTQLSFSDTEDNTVEIRAEPAEEAVLQKEIDVNTAGPSEEPQAVVEVNDPPQDPRPKDEDHGSEHSSSSPIVTKAPHKQRSFVDQAKEVVTEENNKDDRKRPARSELNNDLSDAFAIIDTSDATTYSSRADRYVNPTLGRRLSTSVKDILPKRQNQADLMKKSPLDDVHMAEDFHFDVNTQLANLPKCHSEDESDPKEERDVDLHITLAAPYREIAQQPPQSCHDVFAVVCLDMEADPDAILVPSKFDDAVSNFLRKYFAGAYVDQICVHCTELADSELGPRYTFRGGLGAFAQRCLINASDEEQRSLPSNSIIGTPTASNWNPEGNQKQRPQPTNSDRWTVAGGGRRPSRPTAEENALPFRRIHIVTVTLSGFTTPPRSNEHRFALICQRATAFTTHPSIWQKQTLNMHSPRGDFVTIYHGCRQSSIKSFCNKGISPQARIPNEFSAEAAFYCTSSLQQAYEHPLHNHPGRDPANNVAVLWFLVPLSVLLGAEAPEAGTAAFKVLQFASPNKEWERFCTKNLYDPDPEYNHEHDIVIGPSCLPGRTRQNVSPLYVHSTNGVPGVQLAFCTRRARKWIGSTVQAAFVEQQSE